MKGKGRWATLTSVNNAAWLAYFALSRYWAALVPSSAATLLVMPSIWTAYRTAHPTGASRGTWLLILGELSCWTIFGVHRSDPRLLALGLTGVTASASSSLGSVTVRAS